MKVKPTIDVYLEGLLVDVVRVHDPADRLRKIRELRSGVSKLDAELRGATRDAILELRHLAPPMTWAEIGDLLGVSHQRAEQLSRT